MLCLASLILFLPRRTIQPGPEAGADLVQESLPSNPQSAHLAPGPIPSFGRTNRVSFPALPEPKPAQRNLVNYLVQFAPEPGGLTDQQAAQWKQYLQILIQQGPEALPAIREFLATNLDFIYAPGAKSMLGYASAREAMIDALARIGGPLAVNVISEVLQTTADPHEIAQLASNLESLEPGLHQENVLNAARQSLALAADGKLVGRDVAPLFELYQLYGGPEAVAELESQAKTWNYYATIALANLPNEQGIPALIQRAQDDRNSPALMLLVQAATESQVARNALIEQVRQNKLSASSWGMLRAILGGSQLYFQDSAFTGSGSSPNPDDQTSIYIPSSNEGCVIRPTKDSLAPEHVIKQTALIDELLSVTSDQLGVHTLQQAKGLLASRASQLAVNAVNSTP